MRQAPGLRDPLWRPAEARVRTANLTRFIEHVNSSHQLDIGSYAELHRWSVTEIADFWAVMWEFAQIRSSRAYDSSSTISGTSRARAGSPVPV